MRARRGHLLAVLWLLASCALTAPPAETLLATGDAGAVTGDLATLDRLAAEALAASKQQVNDAEAALLAAALLFQAADLRLQRGSLAALDARPDADLAAVLTADDHVADAVRTEILSLCTDGRAAAERAAAAGARDVRVALYRGLHLSLIAWANGPARSLFAGYGSSLVTAIDAALAADPEFGDGAPLRLSGRFRSKAPWPYGDLPAAQKTLERAVALAPIAINRLFLGDALWAAGERDGAAAEWRAAVTAVGDESTRWSTPLLQELARRRLAALSRTPP